MTKYIHYLGAALMLLIASCSTDIDVISPELDTTMVDISVVAESNDETRLLLDGNRTEWEVGDLRWYLQRPVVSVRAFFAAICDPRNNGGFTVTLDNTFFTDDNPYYGAAWWTLSMIASEDRNTQACLNNVLAASKSPMDYLVSFAKVFGLLFLWDNGRRSVRIVTRATFYGENADEVIDLKSTKRYSPDSRDYSEHWQHRVYPYCLVKSGMLSEVGRFVYLVAECNANKEGVVDGQLFREPYEVFVYEYERQLRDFLSYELLPWLDDHREQITNDKIFND